MTSASTQRTSTLFQQWRRGNANAGKAMAQRFTDWFYTLSVLRHGEKEGDAGFRTACEQFSQNIGKVADVRQLHAWAHDLASKHILVSSAPKKGDAPNAYTGEKSPSALLRSSSDALQSDLDLLLRLFHQGDRNIDAIRAYNARLRVKAWLRDHAGIPFKVVPSKADPDLAPVPYYEASALDGRTTKAFELFLLEEPVLCRDLAEFAAYTHALRAGLPSSAPALQMPTAQPPASANRAPEAAAAAAPAKSVAPSTPRAPVSTGLDEPAPASGNNKMPIFIGIGVLLALGAAGFLFMGS